MNVRGLSVPGGLLVACIVYVLLRAVILYTAFDDVSIPIFELPGVGMIPKIALDGWHGPSPRAYYDNCGGLISTGILTIPFYALFGETYLTLKLVPATLGFGALLLLWRYLDRNWSRRAADLGALSFALLPPTLTRFSLIAQGNHFENLFFQLVVLTAFAAAQERPASRLRVFLFGLAAGFAIFTYFGSLAIVTLTAVLHGLLRGLRRGLRDLALYLPGFLLGLTPLVWVALANGSPQAKLKGLLVSGGRREFEPLDRIADLASVLPRAGSFESLGPVPSAVGEGLFLAAFLLAWLSLLPSVARALGRPLRGWWRERGDATIQEGFAGLRHAPFVLYFPTILVVVVLGNLRFSTYIGPVEIGSYRYFVPHFMYASMVIGAALAWPTAREIPRAARLTGRLVGGAALASLPFALAFIPLAPEHPGQAPHYRGYWMPYYNGVALQHQRFERETGRYRWDLEEVRESISGFPPHEREEVLFGIGYHLAMALDHSPGYREAPRVADVVEGFPEADHTSLARGMGSFLAKGVYARGKRRARGIRFLKAAAVEGHELTPHVLAGLALPNAFPLTTTLDTRFERARGLAEHLPWLAQVDWLRGRGMAFGRLAGREQPADDPLLVAELTTHPPTPPAPFWHGAGQGIATQAEPERAASILERWVPEAHRLDAWRGLGTELARYWPAAVEPESWAAQHAPEQDAREAFLAGWRGARD